MKARKPRKRPAKVRYYSRPMMLRLLSDLCDRLHKQHMVLDAITETNKPNGRHTVLEHRVRTVIGISLESQLRGLNDIAEFARIIRDRAGPPGDGFTRIQPFEWGPRPPG
jgi:hypothetical protein